MLSGSGLGVLGNALGMSGNSSGVSNILGGLLNSFSQNNTDDATTTQAGMNNVTQAVGSTVAQQLLGSFGF